MKIQFKKLKKSAKPPQQKHKTDAAWDLTATGVSVGPNGSVIYGTGIAVAIPEGYFGLLCARSSVCKTELYLANGVGIIDSEYRGEIKAVFKRRPYGEQYAVGDRICQLIILPRPTIEWSETENLDETERGEGGFGSTNKRTT